MDFLNMTFSEEIENVRNCNMQLHLQSTLIEPGKKSHNSVKKLQNTELLFKSSLNTPIVVSWPKAMKLLKEKDIIKKIYPEANKKRYLGTKKYFTIFAEARNKHK